jgi:hypothetical protein
MIGGSGGDKDAPFLPRSAVWRLGEVGLGGVIAVLYHFSGELHLHIMGIKSLELYLLSASSSRISQIKFLSSIFHLHFKTVEQIH